MAMQPFVRLEGVAAPLPEDNIDTDVIYPARFLLITARDGLGRYAFHDRRHDGDGQVTGDFILDRRPWQGAPILVTGSNFGCGSSREQAVWALLGAGIRCVIATGFGEIFESNCVRNGILPVTLDKASIAPLMRLAEAGQSLTVDLEQQCIGHADLGERAFFLREERRQPLLHGWDDTDLILHQWGEAIDRFEAAQQRVQPWLYRR
jgi:3-isopropylmalate/(R)-2-methylmalate dehydratase small subunit